MRLEIDTTISAPPITEVTEAMGGVDSAEVKSVLNQGIKAAQAGNRAQARTSLMRATELDPHNESAWLWLASISEYPEELLGFLNHVLDVNPENQRALEWKAATHGLLSKTFVQRGIDASMESKKDFATECFQTALEYDERNADAWIWLASLSDSNTVKVSLLENAIAINPENESATEALATARASIQKQRLAEAKAAAVAGDHPAANHLLEALLEVNPHSIDAWIMKSHLSDSFDEKIRCFESILAIEPDNIAAKAGRDSLLAIFGSTEAASSESMVDTALVDGETVELHEASIDEPAMQNLEVSEAIAYEFVSPTPQVETDNYPEENTYHEHFESPSEPFASFAEEAPELDEATVAEDQPAVVDSVNDHDRDAFAAAEPEYETGPHYADPQAETVAFNYSFEPAVEDLYETSHPSADEPAHFETVEESHETSHLSPDETPYFEGVNEPYDDAEIAMPSDHDFDSQPADEPTEVLTVKAESYECPFCMQANDAQTISCLACKAVLTLSDLELLLANQNSDKALLRKAVEEMERQRLGREFYSDEMVTLGIGHINLRNFAMGYACLVDASKINPNNVVLSGQVNALLIRLDEIKKQEEAHLKMPKGKSILVVDDSPTVRKLISGKLEKCGHEVICANDGVEAMERLEHFVPDLVLLDITMPRMDGYQVCKQIRSNDATRDVTVVMISGKDGFFDKVRGRMAGTTGYITKPFGPETLMKAVEMYLSGEAPDLDEV